MTNTPTLDLWALLRCTTAHFGALSQGKRVRVRAGAFRIAGEAPQDPLSF